MKRLKFFISTLCGCLALTLQAGDTLTLTQCWALGRDNYPLAKQGALIDESLKVRLRSLDVASYFPRLNIVGEASYQSDVPNIGEALPAGLPVNISPLSKDHYKVGIEVQQTIFDARKSATNKAVERLNSTESRQLNEADLHTLKQQIQQIYFTALTQQSYKATFELALGTLNERIAYVRTAVLHGASTSRDLNLLEVEKLNVEKQIAETEANRQACLKVLEILTGTEFPTNTALKLPDTPFVENMPTENKRAEMAAFDTRMARLMATKGILTTEMLPKILAFGNVYYGRPSYNMLSNDFEPFYMVGLRFTWIPWDGNAIKKEKKNLDIQAKIMANQKAAFDETVRTAAWNAYYEIGKQAALLKHDVQIVELRKNITAESASQLRNGVLTTSDYIADLNAETNARLSVERTKIQLVGAQLNYLLTLGGEAISVRR
jgi:outer membrane protein TolC